MQTQTQRPSGLFICLEMNEQLLWSACPLIFILFYFISSSAFVSLSSSRLTTDCRYKDRVCVPARSTSCRDTQDALPGERCWPVTEDRPQVDVLWQWHIETEPRVATLSIRAVSPCPLVMHLFAGTAFPLPGSPALLFLTRELASRNGRKVVGRLLLRSDLKLRPAEA